MLGIILSALITGIFTFMATIIAIYHPDIFVVFKRSSRSLKGTWIGTGEDVTVPNLLEYGKSLRYELTGIVKQMGSRIKLEIESISDRSTKFKAKGVIRGEFFSFSYKNIERGTENFGVGLAYIRGTGKDIEGFTLVKRQRERGLAMVHFKLSKIA